MTVRNVSATTDLPLGEAPALAGSMRDRPVTHGRMSGCTRFWAAVANIFSGFASFLRACNSNANDSTKPLLGRCSPSYEFDSEDEDSFDSSFSDPDLYDEGLSSFYEKTGAYDPTHPCLKRSEEPAAKTVDKIKSSIGQSILQSSARPNTTSVNPDTTSHSPQDIQQMQDYLKRGSNVLATVRSFKDKHLKPGQIKDLSGKLSSHIESINSLIDRLRRCDESAVKGLGSEGIRTRYKEITSLVHYRDQLDKELSMVGQVVNPSAELYLKHKDDILLVIEEDIRQIKDHHNQKILEVAPKKLEKIIGRLGGFIRAEGNRQVKGELIAFRDNVQAGLDMVKELTASAKSR